MFKYQYIKVLGGLLLGLGLMWRCGLPINPTGETTIKNLNSQCSNSSTGYIKADAINLRANENKVFQGKEVSAGNVLKSFSKYTKMQILSVTPNLPNSAFVFNPVYNWYYVKIIDENVTGLMASEDGTDLWITCDPNFKSTEVTTTNSVVSFETSDGYLELQELTRDWKPYKLKYMGTNCPVMIKKRGATADKYHKKSMEIKWLKENDGGCKKSELPEILGEKRRRAIFNASFQDYSFLRNHIVMKTIRKIAKRWTREGKLGSSQNNDLFKAVAPDSDFIRLKVRWGSEGANGVSLYQVLHDPESHIEDKYADPGIFKNQYGCSWESEQQKISLVQNGGVFEQKTEFSSIDKFREAVQRFCSGDQQVISKGHYFLLNMVHHYFGNSDVWYKNYYSYFTPDINKWAFYNWDADLTVGLHCADRNCDSVSIGSNYLTDWVIGGTGGGHAGHLLCFEKNGMTNDYFSYYKEAIRSELNPDSLKLEIEKDAQAMRAAAQEDLNIWKRNFGSDNPGQHDINAAIKTLIDGIGQRDRAIRPQINAR